MKCCPESVDGLHSMTYTRCMSPSQLNIIAATFNIDPNAKSIKVVRIKFLGKYVTLNSGKTIWKRIGDAKSALIHHLGSQARYRQRTAFSDLINSYNDRPMDDPNYYLPAPKDIKAFSRDLEKLGYIEYVVLEDN